MNLLIGLMPALFWGFQSISAKKIGGSPYNQILGTTLGAGLFGLGVYIINKPELALEETLPCFLSGACYAFGQVLLYASFEKMDVSKAMPITTGMQLIGNAMAGVLLFGEWESTKAKVIGFSAIVLIILGVMLTSYSEKKTKDSGMQMKKGVLMLFVSLFGFIGYSIFPKPVEMDGWDKFVPQSAGMLITAVIIVLCCTKGHALKEKKSYHNIITGCVFAIPALLYLISTSINGVATGFALSQMMVVVAALGSIWLLGESKTRKEMSALLFGLAAVVLGGALIALGTA